METITREEIVWRTRESSDTQWFTNYYECECGHTWEDQWSCMVDDECPNCGCDVSPADADEWEVIE